MDLLRQVGTAKHAVQATCFGGVMHARSVKSSKEKVLLARNSGSYFLMIPRSVGSLDEGIRLPFHMLQQAQEYSLIHLVQRIEWL